MSEKEITLEEQIEAVESKIDHGIYREALLAALATLRRVQKEEETVFHPNCNYMAKKGTVCNKCGQIVKEMSRP